MKLGPLNIAIEGGGPGWKTSLVGLLKLANTTTAVVLGFYNVNPAQGALALSELPAWLVICALVHLVLSAIGSLLAQDKTYDGQQTASRAVTDAIPAVPITSAYVRDAKDVAERVAMQQQMEQDRG